MLSILKKKFSVETKSTNRTHSSSNSYLYSTGKPVWSDRSYDQFANHAYIKNVIAYRAINLVAQGAASVPIRLYEVIDGKKYEKTTHPALDLLAGPNPLKSGAELLSDIYIYRQIHGNAYLLAVGSNPNIEIHSLRPDRVQVLAGNNFLPLGYRYNVDNIKKDYYVDQITGKSEILHVKNFHPLSDWYGLSSIEAASYSIDQHNQAGAWNQALLQNGARPSGVMTVKDLDGKPASLTTEQFSRVKNMVNEAFSGPTNAGRPMILEGGLEWKEISFTPKDMDFIAAKHSSARDIALAFGVPPQLLGIPGDNTYNNLKEARIALWEHTILPLVDNTLKYINKWLRSILECDFEITYNPDNIPALSLSRQTLWENIDKISFMSVDEKRSMVGLGAIQKNIKTNQLIKAKKN